MVVLAIDKILRAYDRIAAQLGSIAAEIKKCESRSNTEKHVIVVRTVDEKDGTHHRWRVRLLLRLNLQSLVPCFFNHRITDVCEAALALESHHLRIQLRGVYWFANVYGQSLLD